VWVFGGKNCRRRGRSGRRAETGKSLGEDRKALRGAITFCKRRGLPLVAACFSRLVRHKDYHPVREPHLRPTVGDVWELDELLDGVTVYTLHDPNADPESDRILLSQL
jgi:hypothetical protein